MKNYLLTCILAFFVLACNRSNNQNDFSTLDKLKTSKTSNHANFTKSDIAKFAISVLMSQPPSTMKTEQSGDLLIVSYIRARDERRFSYKIKYNNEIIIWGVADGRWRIDDYDEKLSFSEQRNNIVIIQEFSDGSKEHKEFSMQDL